MNVLAVNCDHNSRAVIADLWKSCIHYCLSIFPLYMLITRVVLLEWLLVLLVLTSVCIAHDSMHCGAVERILH